MSIFKRYVSIISWGILIFTLIFLPSYFNGYSFDFSISLAELFDNQRFDDMLQERMTYQVFSERIIVSHSVVLMANSFELPNQFCYNIINLGCLTSIFIFLKKIAAHFNVCANYSVALLAIFFPFLFCNNSNMSGFDDYAQWALSIVAFYLFCIGNNLLALSFLFVAILTRETTLFLLPFYFYIMEKRKINIIIYFLSVFVSLFILFKLVEQNELAKEFLFKTRFTAFNENFGNFKLNFKSLWAIFISVFIPIYLSYFSKAMKINYHWILLTIVSIMALFVSIFSSLIDESRIIFYPLILSVPFWEEGILYVARILKFRHRIEFIFYLVSVFLSFFMAFHFYSPCVAKSCLVYQIYFFLTSSITLVYLFKYVSHKYLKDVFLIEIVKNK